MGKIKPRIILTLIAACSLAAALFFALLPVRAFADTASDTLAAQNARNEKLVVKYGLDETSTGSGATLTAYKWDSASQTFVIDPSAAATVQNHVNNNDVGTVTPVSGVEGSGALSFTGKAHARAKFHLPANATGMTVSLWVKNLTTYWGSLVEFWDGTDGGRFGKGTMQGNGGRKNEADPWSSNCQAHKYAQIAQGGGWDSFVTEVNSDDNGGANVDLMQKDVWYQVTYVITSTEMKAYRDGELKQTFIDGVNTPTDWWEANPSKVLTSIMKAAKSENGNVGIRLGHDTTKTRADILDDFRIYNGAMDASEVQALYGEYSGISALYGKTVQIDGFNKEYTVDSDIRVESTSEEFPKILIGGVSKEAVTLSEGVYSASGNGFSYSYTVGDYNEENERIATVTYHDTVNGYVRVFTVTQIYKETVKLTSLQIKVNGVLRNINGFDPDITEYTVKLSPDAYSVEFVAEVANEGESDVQTVNENIAFNGENVITTSATTGNGEPASYKITLQRDRSDTALPVLGGVQLGLATQNIYVDELPSSVAQSSLVLVYPNGSEVEDYAYDASAHTVTFKIADKVLGNKTAYTVAYKTKQEGHLAQWSFESSKSNADKVFPGTRWDAAQGAYVEDSALEMTVRSGAEDAAVTDRRDSIAATRVTGVKGNGIELAAWSYTTANIPAVAGGTTGFTFSTWMKTSGIVWESIFTVLGKDYGTILEKGHMQRHTMESTILDGNQPINGWKHLSNSMGDWVDWSLSSENAKKDYFNTPSNGASYVFYTVTVTYVNGAGTIKFYKDGELAVTYENDEGGTDKAKIIIEAMNAGASVGLHRHHYDGGQTSRFDEANVYAYAMTDEEVRAAYGPVAELLSASPEYYEVEGLGYPDLLLGGAKAVSAADGKMTGVTKTGVTYSYTPLTVAAMPENDEKGVEVTFTKNDMERVATIKFHRTLSLTAASLGYKIGDGDSVAIDVPENAGEDIIVKVAADTDLSNVTAGDIAVQPLDGESNTENYQTQFTYSAQTQTATVRFSYTVYKGFDTLYTIKFVKKSTATFEAMSITGGSAALNLTQEDFTENSVNVTVGDLTDFTLSVSLSLAAGAEVIGKTTFTQDDLQGGKLAVTVMNENGDSVVYYLVPVAVSSDTTLSALSAGSYGLELEADKTEYSLTVNKGEGANVFAALDVTATDDGATVQKIYNKTDSVIIVTVTAADGVTVQKYLIAVNERDTDATLSQIKVGGTAVADFDPETNTYTVKYAGELPAVTATAASATAQAPSVSTAADGKVTITVTAENGATKEYTVTLVKKSSDAALKKLTLNGTDVTLEGNNARYHAPAGTRLSSIIVAAETAEDASISRRINEAENQIIFTVTAEDGTAATYTVTVSTLSGSVGEGGVTEDNSPQLNSSLGAGAIAGISVAAVAAAAGLSVGIWLILKKLRKTR